VRIAFTRAAQASACVAAAAAALALAGGMRGIVSESMPRGVYYSHAFSGQAQRGDTVEVCLPTAISHFARGRGYLAPGIFCDDGVQRIVKSVLAVPGDTVDVSPEGLRVRGHLIPNTAARSHDSRGRRLPRIHRGRYAVAHGTLWLFSSQVPTSFDSRYFGPVPASAIKRRFHPLWTEACHSPPRSTIRR
jgi:conjugative transfer signal peptidase TraF